MIVVLRVAKILDKRTLVIEGEKPRDLEGISKGNTLVIVAVNRSIKLSDGSPLVVPKAEVEVTANMGSYLIAQPEPETVEEETFVPLFAQKTKRKVVPNLRVSESQASGNPASTEIKIGDQVVAEYSLADFVAQLKDEGFGP